MPWLIHAFVINHTRKVEQVRSNDFSRFIWLHRFQRPAENEHTAALPLKKYFTRQIR